MIRFLLIFVVVAAVFVLYSLVDAVVSDPRRARGVSKPVWIIVILLLPVIGGVLWFTLGRGKVAPQRAQSPDDDPDFLKNLVTSGEFEQRIQDIEDELASLDSDVSPSGSDSQTPGSHAQKTDAEGRVGRHEAGAGETHPDDKNSNGPRSNGTGSDAGRPDENGQGPAPKNDQSKGLL
ncbi:PLD nuclease N-terminal domain-containing protein [Lysinibacter sp. HNR]|uniref:PLD nuclease N-terminal domain-containing protein n=1 Tax=Lysinibacter sp. HNR TaxID=3031408 RepID=UPI0024351FD8|nr:PLD nuclease N-terminal domain-containing protein [Lysinibacter sp. HNR]WGD37804.1 PLD nuclease N-terminal domain-containing protein [Lysinibacter sp. HNR]